MLVFGAVCSFLEPFGGHLSPKVDKYLKHLASLMSLCLDERRHPRSGHHACVCVREREREREKERDGDRGESERGGEGGGHWIHAWVPIEPIPWGHRGFTTDMIPTGKFIESGPKFQVYPAVWLIRENGPIDFFSANEIFYKKSDYINVLLLV